ATFDVSSGGVLAALAGTDWPALRDLDLRVSGADPDRPHPAWFDLADVPWFPRLRALNLAGACLGDGGVSRLLARGRPLALTELPLRGNIWSAAGVRRLTARPELRTLRVVVTGYRAGARPPHRIDGVLVYE